MVSSEHAFKETSHKPIRPEGAGTVSNRANDIFEILSLIYNQSVSKFQFRVDCLGLVQ
jgi:hypothetical protein